MSPVSTFDPKPTLQKRLLIRRQHSTGEAASRELQVEGCAMFIAWRGPDTPAMFFDDGPAERQTYAGARRLGRVEGFKDVLHVFGCDADAAIADLKQHFLAV